MNRQKGFTLTEVLFSVGIMSMVLIGVIVIFVQTVDVSKRIDYEYIATNLVKSRIERARSVMDTNGFDALPDLDETDTVVGSDGVSNPDGNFKRSTTVTANHAGDARQTLVEVSIIYRYRSVWKDDAVITMATIFSDVS